MHGAPDHGVGAGGPAGGSHDGVEDDAAAGGEGAVGPRGQSGSRADPVPGVRGGEERLAGFDPAVRRARAGRVGRALAAYLAESDSERLSAKDLEALRAIARKIGEAQEREGQS